MGGKIGQYLHLEAEEDQPRGIQVAVDNRQQWKASRSKSHVLGVAVAVVGELRRQRRMGSKVGGWGGLQECYKQHLGLIILLWDAKYSGVSQSNMSNQQIMIHS